MLWGFIFSFLCPRSDKDTETVRETDGGRRDQEIKRIWLEEDVSL